MRLLIGIEVLSVCIFAYVTGSLRTLRNYLIGVANTMFLICIDVAIVTGNHSRKRHHPIPPSLIKALAK